MWPIFFRDFWEVGEIIEIHPAYFVLAGWFDNLSFPTALTVLSHNVVSQAAKMSVYGSSALDKVKSRDLDLADGS